MIAMLAVTPAHGASQVALAPYRYLKTRSLGSQERAQVW
jgi:hypothetical protein